MIDEELKKLLMANEGDNYFFDRDTTFIKEQTITVQAGGNFFNGSQKDKKIQDDTSEKLSPLQQELMPLFLNDAGVVDRFVKEVNGASNPAVAEIINRYIADGRILMSQRKKPLWEVLSKYGIYTVGYDNFKARVN